MYEMHTSHVKVDLCAEAVEVGGRSSRVLAAAVKQTRC